MVEPELWEVPGPLVQAQVQATARQEEDQGEDQESQGHCQEGEGGGKGSYLFPFSVLVAFQLVIFLNNNFFPLLVVLIFFIYRAFLLFILG